MNRRRFVLSVVVVLLLTQGAQAGPFWWLFPRRRRRVYYAQPQYQQAPAQPAAEPAHDPPEHADDELTAHPVIQSLHATDTQYRNQAGLDALELHSLLCHVAQEHAERMARTGQFSHYAGGAPWDRAYAAGWPSSAAENIAMGYTSVGACYRGWYSSVGHRNNMLGSHVYVGFGYALSAGGTPYWVAMYSR